MTANTDIINTVIGHVEAFFVVGESFIKLVVRVLDGLC